MPDYSIPPWIANPPNYSESFARGAAVGTGIGRSFAAAMESKRQNEREDALFPLREQVMQQQIQSGALDLQVAQEKRLDALANKEAFTALSKTMADISAAGAWNNPASEARVWELGSRWPSLVDTKEFQNATSQFDKAAAAERLKSSADARAKALEAEASLDKSKLQFEEKKHTETISSREKIAAEHEKTLRENARIKLEQKALESAFDVLPRAEFFLFKEQAHSIFANDTLTEAQKARQANAALERLKETVQKKGGSTASPPAATDPAGRPMTPSGAPQSGGQRRVRVKNPQGKIGTVPLDQIKSLPSGWEILDEG